MRPPGARSRGRMRSCWHCGRASSHGRCSREEGNSGGSAAFRLKAEATQLGSQVAMEATVTGPLRSNMRELGGGGAPYFARPAKGECRERGAVTQGAGPELRRDAGAQGNDDG